MKKFLSVFLSLILVLSSAAVGFTASAASVYDEPAYIEEKGGYQIGTASELYWFAESVNSGNASANAVLTADITVNEGDVAGCNGVKAEGWLDWTPMGSSDEATGRQITYKGVFDGQNHSVGGIYFNNPEASYVGLFGNAWDAEIKNLTVKNSYINGKTNVSAVCAYLRKGSMNNCSAEGCTVIGRGNVGGVCGSMLYVTEFTDCSNTGTVTGNANVGGVAGQCDSDLTENCFNSGTVTGVAAEYIARNIGGVCGVNIASPFKNCRNEGKVSADKNAEIIGGICGSAQQGASHSDCYNSGEIGAGQERFVGGLFGELRGGKKSGEIVRSSALNCCNLSTVSGSAYVGGICGKSSLADITNCYNIGSVGGSVYLGSLCGNAADSTIANCYYLDACGAAGAGEAKTQEQFASGEVCYLLNGSSSEGELAWYQNLDNGEASDSLPKFEGGTVFANAAYACDGTTPLAVSYSNTEKSEPTVAPHSESEWIVDRGATLTESGERHIECKNCGKTLKTEVIPQLEGSSIISISAVDDVNYPGLIPVEVKTSADVRKVQFLYGSATATYTRDSARVLSVTENDDGTLTWIINVSAYAAGEMTLTAHARTYSGGWETETRESSVQISEIPKEYGEIISVEKASEGVPAVGGYADLLVKVSKDSTKLQARYADGSTRTYLLTAENLTEENADYNIYRIGVKVGNESQYEYDLAVRGKNGWNAQTVLVAVAE